MVALSFGLLKSRPLSLSGEIPVLSFRSDLIKFQKRFYLVGMLSSFFSSFNDGVNVRVVCLSFQLLCFRLAIPILSDVCRILTPFHSCIKPGCFPDCSFHFPFT